MPENGARPPHTAFTSSPEIPITLAIAVQPRSTSNATTLRVSRLNSTATR